MSRALGLITDKDRLKKSGTSRRHPRQRLRRMIMPPSDANRIFLVYGTFPLDGWGRAEVDNKSRPLWMTELAACVRHGFLYSNQLRDNVHFYLIPENTDTPMAILLDGSHLRYLEPSERTTLLLLGRALASLRHRSDSPREVTPGIYVVKWGIPEIFEYEKQDSLTIIKPSTDASNVELISSILTKSIRQKTLCVAVPLSSSNNLLNWEGDTNIHLLDASYFSPNTIILIVNIELDRVGIP